MKTIGSHPGAILFRLSIMGIVIAILIVTFFAYVDRVQDNAERAAILRTRDIINSSLVVLFATYATQSRLVELNDLPGSNPFDILRQYSLVPGNYIGEIDHGLSERLEPGWYYLSRTGQVGYKSRYLDESPVFELILQYEDNNRSGRFEPGPDVFRGLHFVPVETRDQP